MATTYVHWEPTAYPYDAYLRELGVDYWWDMNTNFGTSDSANRGDAGSAPLVFRGPKTGALYNQTGLVSGTENAGSLSCGGAAFNWLNVNGLRVNGLSSFTAGGWYNVPNVFDGQLLFRSNMGGIQGRWRGMDIYHAYNTDYLIVSLGTNLVSGGNLYYRLATPAGSFPINTTNFVAVYCSPTTDPLTVTLKLYINGTQRTLTYSAGTGNVVAWPVTDSSIDSWNGVAWGAAGDTYGGRFEGRYDKPFFTAGELTAAQILELYNRGSA